MNEAPQFTVETRRMTCAKYDGDAPKETRFRHFLRKLGLPVSAAPFKAPVEIIIVEEGKPTQRIFPETDKLSKAEILALLDHSHL